MGIGLPHKKTIIKSFPFCMIGLIEVKLKTNKDYDNETKLINYTSKVFQSGNLYLKNNLSDFINKNNKTNCHNKYNKRRNKSNCIKTAQSKSYY